MLTSSSRHYFLSLKFSKCKVKQDFQCGYSNLNRSKLNRKGNCSVHSTFATTELRDHLFYRYVLPSIELEGHIITSKLTEPNLRENLNQLIFLLYKLHLLSNFRKRECSVWSVTLEYLSSSKKLQSYMKKGEV